KSLEQFEDRIDFKDSDGQVTATVHKNGPLFTLTEAETANKAFEMRRRCPEHARFGHVSSQILVSAIKYGIISKVRGSALADELKKADNCPHCDMAKMTRVPHTNTRDYTALDPRDLVHADIVGPFKHNIEGEENMYVLTLVDAASKFKEVKLLNSKAEASQKIISTLSNWTNQYGPVKVLYTDNEFNTQELKGYCE